MPDGMRKVMVVEDSEAYASMLLAALNHSRRFRIVWWAKDGQEAISYLAGEGRFSDRQRYPYPEAVLLDIQLPVKNGFEVLDSIAEQKKKPKVVMLTVLKHEGNHQKALQAGADAFKEKPYEEQKLTEFVRWLDEWIGIPPAGDAAPQSRTHSRKGASPGKPQPRG